MRRHLFILLAAMLLPATAHAWSVAVGRSVRPHDIDLALQLGPVQLEYIDEGAQPYGIPNRNRPVNLDYVLEHAWGRFDVFAKAGVTSSWLSYNGSGNGYRNRTGFTGQNVGVGLKVRVLPRVWLVGQTVWMRYQQSDVPAYEPFTYSSLLLQLDF